jgi:hypothetical protein
MSLRVEHVMRPVLPFFRRHWPAILAIAYLTWRMSREGIRDVTMWISAGLAVLGIVLNLVVILANGGMPAAVREDEIPDEEKPHYHPIGDTTRLAFFSDWIPVGNLMISPGDVLLLIAVVLLLVRSALGSFG